MGKKIKVPSEGDIRQYYLIENHSLAEMEEKFQASERTVLRWLKLYNITKPKELSIQQSQQTCAEKYGSKSYFQTKTFRDNWKQHNLEKYGVECNLQSDVCKAKIKNTNLTKYGVENAMQNKDIREKAQQTCLKKYGVSSYSQTAEYVDKCKKTNLERYGVTNYNKTEESKKRHKQTCLDKYQTFTYKQKDIQHYETYIDRDKMSTFLTSLSKKPDIMFLMEYFNVSDVAIGNKIHEYHLESYVHFQPNISHYESEIIDFLKTLEIVNIEQSNRTILDGQEIDIYLPDYKLGIEFNGNYWHSDALEKFQDHNGRSVYHQNKSLLAESHNVFLFHIFEYEWNNPVTQLNIKNRLKAILGKNTNHIYARKCKIVEIDKKTKKAFLSRNHIQGNDHSTIALGLEYQNQLVAVMSFLKSKNKYTWELSRFCTMHDTIISGGASKLFTYFTTNYMNSSETIVSYSDFTKADGRLYKLLDFHFQSLNNPNYVWINLQTGDIRTRYQEQAAGEVERMHLQGYHRICDCGTKTWLYTKQ